MKAVGYRVAFRAGESTRVIESETLAAHDDADIHVSLDVMGAELVFSVTAKTTLVLESAEVRLRHAFRTGEQVLLNGYQSWTDTYERPVWGSMRGLEGVPRAVVNRYALDASGDYRFCPYSPVPGCMHGFTYAVFRLGHEAALAASLDESKGFTVIRTDASSGRVTLSTECPQKRLLPGTVAVIGRYVVLEGRYADIYDRWMRIMRIKARSAKPLVGYTSWYRHYDKIDQTCIRQDLASTAGAMDVLPAPGAVRLFQIDDGWCHVGDWLSPHTEKFADGMAALAGEIRDAGFTPGLWAAPFVCERDSQLFARHQEWLLRDEAGALVRTGSHWSGAYALDTRNPEVRTYVETVLRTLTREWGFKLLKLDFLYAACMLPHDGMNRGQLMADAVDLIRRAVGEETLVLACGVPLGSVFGKVEYCRIGCDVGLDWDDKPWMRGLHRERVSTKNSLASTLGRAPLDGRVFANDPDVFFLRKDVKLSESQKMQLLDTDARMASVLLTSDDMGTWRPQQRRAYLRAMSTLLERKANAQTLAALARVEPGPSPAERMRYRYGHR